MAVSVVAWTISCFLFGLILSCIITFFLIGSLKEVLVDQGDSSLTPTQIVEAVRLSYWRIAYVWLWMIPVFTGISYWVIFKRFMPYVGKWNLVGVTILDKAFRFSDEMEKLGYLTDDDQWQFVRQRRIPLYVSEDKMLYPEGDKIRAKRYRHDFGIFYSPQYIAINKRKGCLCLNSNDVDNVVKQMHKRGIIHAQKLFPGKIIHLVKGSINYFYQIATNIYNNFIDRTDHLQSLSGEVENTVKTNYNESIQNEENPQKLPNLILGNNKIEQTALMINNSYPNSSIHSNLTINGSVNLHPGSFSQPETVRSGDDDKNQKESTANRETPKPESASAMELEQGGCDDANNVPDDLITVNELLTFAEAITKCTMSRTWIKKRLKTAGINFIASRKIDRQYHSCYRRHEAKEVIEKAALERNEAEARKRAGNRPMLTV